MVAQITGLDVEYVRKKLPYAQGLHYRTIYWQRAKIECESLTDTDEPTMLIQ